MAKDKDRIHCFNVTMRAEEKELWVESLKSGKFQQGRGCLLYCTSARCEFCCLGVFLEVKNAPKETGPWGRLQFAKTYATKENTLPEFSWFSQFFDLTLSDASKISQPDANKIKEIGITKLLAHLAHLNDDKLWSFDKIANWIRKNL